MARSSNRNIKIAGISIALILVILACGVNLTNPIPDSNMVTQTFSALSTEMAPRLLAGVTPSVDTEASATAETGVAAMCTPVHTTTPPEPPNLKLWITDKSDISLASMHHALSGSEYFDQNLFERPFTSGVMDYLADIDIIEAYFSRLGDWVFVSLVMSGQNTAGGMTGAYGIEVDNNIDGRGDYLIYGINPTSTTWTTTAVKAYQDTNKDVGGSVPITSDIHPGNGYDTLVFDEGCLGDPDAAWIRVSPSSANTVQLAFKWTLINNNSLYLWGAWAGVPEMLNQAWFDYNDHFTHAIAGSALIELVNYYPLKEFWGWDNTCRWIVGKKFPAGTEPGLCPYAPPEEKCVVNPFTGRCE